MTVRPVLEKLRTALDAAQIPYFVTGSLASSAHGVPRSTNDIDIVIAPTREQLVALVASLPETEFAASLEDALEALASRSQFNVVEYATAWKIDLIFRKENPFDAARFRRRQIVDVAGVHLYTASAEDILITKLWWAKLGESERQIGDAAGVLRVQRDTLDLDYIERWVSILELEPQWQAAQKGAATP